MNCQRLPIVDQVLEAGRLIPDSEVQDRCEAMRLALGIIRLATTTVHFSEATPND